MNITTRNKYRYPDCKYMFACHYNNKPNKFELVATVPFIGTSEKIIYRDGDIIITLSAFADMCYIFSNTKDITIDVRTIVRTYKETIKALKDF